MSWQSPSSNKRHAGIKYLDGVTHPIPSADNEKGAKHHLKKHIIPKGRDADYGGWERSRGYTGKP